MNRGVLFALVAPIVWAAMNLVDKVGRGFRVVPVTWRHGRIGPADCTA
jgi:hypothetical protein